MNYKKLIISLALPQLAGILGSFATVTAISTWYANLTKPFFNPPNWIFGPVWIILYLMIGISSYLIWQKIESNKKAKQALNLFWLHLVFNASWSLVFFGLQRPGLAFVNIIILWIFILVLIIRFWKINKVASYLLMPYFLWVSFASILNFAIWYLNL